MKEVSPWQRGSLPLRETLWGTPRTVPQRAEEAGGWSTHTGPRGGRRWRGWRFSHRSMRDGLSEKVTREQKPEGSGRARRGAWGSVQAEGSIACVACLLQGATYTPKPETALSPRVWGTVLSKRPGAHAGREGTRRVPAGWAPGAQCISEVTLEGWEPGGGPGRRRDQAEAQDGKKTRLL